MIAGATGAVGSELVRLASARGHWTRSLARRSSPGASHSVQANALDPVAIRGVCDGIDTVISCLGASVSVDAPEKRSYLQVDTVANRNLVAEAMRARTPRMVYVAAHLADGYRDTAYIQAHEQVVDSLRASGLSYTIIRPTGIFTALDDILKMARRGLGVVIGSGNARTNPIHAADVAQACLDHLAEGPQEAPIGGPDVLTRRDIVETALTAAGRRGRVFSVPPGVMRLSARFYGRSNARKAELFHFAAAVTTTDCVAPLVGARRLDNYFRDRASAR